MFSKCKPGSAVTLVFSPKPARPKLTSKDPENSKLAILLQWRIARLWLGIVGGSSSLSFATAHFLSSLVSLQHQVFTEVIKNADMAEDMQQDAIDCATQALEKYNIEKDSACLAKRLSAAMSQAHLDSCFVHPTRFLNLCLPGLTCRTLLLSSKRSLTRSARSFISKWPNPG